MTATVLDPTAGGGSIPFEAVRLGCAAIGNDLNPVAALLLKATVELPLHYGSPLVDRFRAIGVEFVKRVRSRIANLYPQEPIIIPATATYGRVPVNCPYCGGIVPLSPNWKLSSGGSGVRLLPKDGHVRFEIVERETDHSPGTVKGGDGLCPFPDCRRTIDGSEIKNQAQAGRMGHQLYCIVYNEDRIKGYSKNGIAVLNRTGTGRSSIENRGFGCREKGFSGGGLAF